METVSDMSSSLGHVGPTFSHFDSGLIVSPHGYGSGHVPVDVENIPLVVHIATCPHILILQKNCTTNPVVLRERIRSSEKQESTKTVSISVVSEALLNVRHRQAVCLR